VTCMLNIIDKSMKIGQNWPEIATARSFLNTLDPNSSTPT
jgi:hypothetical protein